MSVRAKKPRIGAQDKLIAELQRLFTATGDPRFAAAVEAAREHPSAFRSRGRPRLSDEQRTAKVQAAKEAEALAVLEAISVTEARRRIAEEQGISDPEGQRRYQRQLKDATPADVREDWRGTR